MFFHYSHQYHVFVILFSKTLKQTLCSVSILFLLFIILVFKLTYYEFSLDISTWRLTSAVSWKIMGHVRTANMYLVVRFWEAYLSHGVFSFFPAWWESVIIYYTLLFQISFIEKLIFCCLLVNCYENERYKNAILVV